MCRVVVAPCSPFSVTPQLMRDSAELARRHEVRLHTHLAETLDEERFCVEKFGMRPFELMEDLGWTGDDVWYAHGIHLNDAEVDRIAEVHTGVAHCPSSNMRLGAGACRVEDLVRAGARVGLGVDGSATRWRRTRRCSWPGCVTPRRRRWTRAPRGASPPRAARNAWVEMTAAPSNPANARTSCVSASTTWLTRESRTFLPVWRSRRRLGLKP